MPNIENHQKREEPHLCCLEQNSGTESRSYTARDNGGRGLEEQRVGSFEERSRIESTQGCLRCLFHRLRDVALVTEWTLGYNDIAESRSVFVLITLECSSWQITSGLGLHLPTFLSKTMYESFVKKLEQML
jgi:hypothetical protein